MIEQNEIDEKLLAYLLDELDDVEREEVKAWLEESECNKEYFREFQRVHLEFQWGVYAREVKSDFNVLRKKLRKHSSLQVWYGVAVAVVILLSVGGMLLWNSGEIEEKPVQVAKKVTIQPGKSQAILVLSSGEEVAMGNVSRQLEEKDGTSVVVSETGRISYQSAEGKGGITKDTARVMNRLVIPRGGEFNLTLSDGTHVWLNADTRLRYPTCFNTDERRVYLEGEAYFQVTKDTAHPFRVESEAQVVEVLGTQFNVYAYGHEEQTYTTLVEGKVAVTASASGQHVQLMPGQQASLGRQGGEIVVGEVNIQQVVDWKNGMFVFDDLSLEAILRKVARWYDVEVFYRNQQAKAIVFKGNLPRYGELPELLKVLENSSEVHFSLKGNALIVE